jgi:hypothetical protein
MKLPGSTQVALGKKLLAAYEWWRMEPRADGAGHEWPLAAVSVAQGYLQPFP